MQKIVIVLYGKLSVKNAPKLSAKYLEENICKIKKIQNISITLMSKCLTLIFKSAKDFLEKCSPQEDFAKTTISKVLSKTFKATIQLLQD